MTASRWVDEQAEATRNAILQCADELFSEFGYQATSVDKIAATARLTKGAVYHHFTGKKQLFAEVYEQLAAELSQALAEVIDATLEPQNKVRAAVEHLLNRADDPRIQTILYRDGPVVLGEQCEEIDERQFLGLVREVLEDLRLKGWLKPMNTLVASRLLFSLLAESTVLMGNTEHVNKTRREVWVVLDALLAGLFHESV